MKPYFIYKNINSRDMGISILKLPPRVKPERRGEMITIPGRDGFLFESEDAYNGKTLEIECTFLPPDNLSDAQIDELVMSIIVWLDGSGKLIFSDYLNYYYEATIVNAIPIERLFKRYRRFIIEFEVQPFSKKTEVTEIETRTVGTHNISVGSYYDVKPITSINASGNVDIRINNQSMRLINLDREIIIDSEFMNVIDTNGNNMNNHIVGEFPILKPGSNEIEIICEEGSTFTSMEIEYRGLWL